MQRPGSTNDDTEHKTSYSRDVFLHGYIQPVHRVAKAVGISLLLFMPSYRFVYVTR